MGLVCLQALLAVQCKVGESQRRAGPYLRDLDKSDYPTSAVHGRSDSTVSATVTPVPPIPTLSSTVSPGPVLTVTPTVIPTLVVTPSPTEVVPTCSLVLDPTTPLVLGTTVRLSISPSGTVAQAWIADMPVAPPNYTHSLYLDPVIYSATPELTLVGRVSAPSGLSTTCAVRLVMNTWPFGRCKFVCNEACPAQHAMFSFQDPAGSRTPTTIETCGTCCPVPTDALIESNVTFTYNDCGDQRVVTGGRAMGAERQLRCTAVNTAVYRLGPELGGVFYLMPGASAASGGRGAPGVAWESLPPGLRYQLLRIENTPRQPYPQEGFYRAAFSETQCIPFPGALMTRKSSKQCGDMAARALLLLNGTPVPMFPDGCTAIADPPPVQPGNRDITLRSLSCTSYPHTGWLAP